MATDDKTQSGAELGQEAELYAKNPKDMAKFTQKREAREKKAKEDADKKAEEAKNNKAK